MSKGITPDLLRWKGIEATLELAASQNAKIVVIGNPDDGLPLILGGLETGPVPAFVPTPAQVEPTAPAAEQAAETPTEKPE